MERVVRLRSSHPFNLLCRYTPARFNLDAGPGFEPGMLRAYETGVVAALPAITIGAPGWNRTTVPNFVGSCILHYTTDALTRSNASLRIRNFLS